MYFSDELKPLLLHKGKLRLPKGNSNINKGSVIFLLAPNENTLIDIINNDNIDTKYYRYLYIEKNVKLFMNNNSLNENDNIINSHHKLILEKDIIASDENVVFLNPLLEIDDSYSNILKRILYNERMKNNKELIEVYNDINKKLPKPKQLKWKLNLDLYNKRNLFYDMSYYSRIFFENLKFKHLKGLDIYLEFLQNYLSSVDFNYHGYDKKTLLIPLSDWYKQDKTLNYMNKINPITLFIKYFKTNLKDLKKVFSGWDILFTIEKDYSFRFKIDDFFYGKDYPKFIRYLNLVIKNIERENVTVKKIDDKKSKNIIKVDIKEKIAKNKNIKIKSITGIDSDKHSDEINDIIDKVVDNNEDEDEINDIIDKDEKINKLIDLSKDEDSVNKPSISRQKRYDKLKKDFKEIDLNGKKISDIYDIDKIDLDLNRVENIKVDSIDDAWNNLSFGSLNKDYNTKLNDYHFIKILEHFSNKVNFPIYVKDIKKEDISTTEDKINLFKISTEDSFGKRTTLEIMLPKFVDDRFLFLKGNKKVLDKQLFPFPVSKIRKDVTQIITNYNRLSIELFGNMTNSIGDRILKTIDKLSKDKKSNLKITYGDSSKINDKYVLPNDYVELSSSIYKLEVGPETYYFNQEYILNLIKEKNVKIEKSLIPFGYNKNTNKFIYYDLTNKDISFSYMLNNLLSLSVNNYKDTFDGINIGKKYAYSRVRILNSRIPLILILAFNEGLLKVLDKANVEYEIIDKGSRYDKNIFDVIRFKDKGIIYKLTNENSILMNGLKTVHTKFYNLIDMEDKKTYIEFLDIFGSRTLSDPIESFYELMIDPISLDILKKLDYPEEFTSLLIKANNTLSDNYKDNYNCIYNSRLRGNEIINAILYKCLCESYEEYKIKLRINKNHAKFTFKPTSVIDKILVLNTLMDLSESTALLEMEESNSVSKKGFGGSNIIAGYKLEKRQFDESMLNVLSMSSVAGPTIGINRSATINSSIKDTYGFIEKNSIESMNAANTLCITEALNPFSNISDAGERVAMVYSQGKHTVRTKRSSPLLVSYGADEAMPYLISNTFAHKAPFSGKIKEINDSYISLESKDGEMYYINRKRITKSVNSGTFNTINLDPCLSVGKSFKKGDIIANDNSSFSGEVGQTNNLAYNVGTFTKIACIAYPFGFEDSCKISNKLAENLTTYVTTVKEINLGKNANIYNIVNINDEINQGDTLMIVQDSFDEENLNDILYKLSSDNDDDDQIVIDELGRIPIKSKYTGKIENIVIYRTVDLDELSPTLRKLCNKYEKPIRELKQKIKKEKCSQNIIDFVNQPIDKLEAKGNLKNVTDGVLILIYTTYEDIMGVGDKLTFSVALKGTIGNIYNNNKYPIYSGYRKNEHIDAFLNSTSINKRMTPSIFKLGASNKLGVEMSRQIKDIMGIKYDVNFR